MNKPLLIILVLLNSSFSFSQNENEAKILEQKLLDYDLKNKTKEPSISDSTKVNLLLELTKVYLDSNPTKDEYYSKKALELSNKINFQKGVALSCIYLGRINNAKSNFNLAISYLKKAIKINFTLNEEESLADAYLYLGQSYLYLNNFTETLKNLNVALKGFEKLKKNVKIARVYNNIGILYGKQGNHNKRLVILFKGLEVLKNEKKEDTDWMINIINSNLGNAYNDLKFYNKSIDIYKKCLAYEEKNGNKNGTALISMNLGVSYLNLNRNDEALSYFSIANQVFEVMGNKSGLGDVLRYKGEAFYNKKQYSEALNFTSKGLQLSTEIGELESIKFGHENLAKIYNKIGNYKLAYENEIKFKKYSDSIFNTEINSKLTQLQLSYDFDKRQEILKLEQQKKDELLKNEAVKQSKIKYIVIIALGFLSLATLYIYYNLKRNQRQKYIIEQQKELVEQQNEQIKKSLTEKETLLREIHHRVKNNLQIISSLLNMQSKNITDENVVASLLEGQSRVQAMSLIHQNLYQSEEIDKVNVENYLRELVEFLSKTFVGDSKAIKVTIVTEGIEFDFDTAIPLGLIVNELVSNAYEHAYKGKDTGNLWIAIRARNTIDYELKVTNDGIGLPEDFEILKEKSMGLKLVNLLARQLRGNFTNISKNNLTTFRVLFKDLKMYQNK